MKNNNSLILLLIAFLLIVSSCSTRTHSIAKTENNVNHLHQTINKLWDARIAKNWELVYSLTDSTFQKTTAIEKFTAMGELQQVMEYKIMETKQIDNVNTNVLLQFTINKMGIIFKPVLNESWLYEPERGWVLNKTKMFSKKPF